MNDPIDTSLTEPGPAGTTATYYPTTAAVITTPLATGRVRHRPDKKKAKQKRKAAKASRKRNR